MEEKNEFIRKLSVLPLQGPVNLKNPDVSIWAVFHYVRVHSNTTEGVIDESQSLKEGDSIENHHLKKVYLGRLVGQGGMREVRRIIHRLSSPG
jgi:hypothetical protein